MGATDHYAGFHGRVVKQIGTQPNDAFNPILFDQLAAHLPFFIAEQHAMREENCAAPADRFEAFKDVLEECIIGPSLWRNAQEIPPEGVAFPTLAVPLFDGVRWDSQYDIELAQTVTLDQLWISQGITALDAMDEVIRLRSCPNNFNVRYSLS